MDLPKHVQAHVFVYFLFFCVLIGAHNLVGSPDDLDL